MRVVLSLLLLLLLLVGWLVRSRENADSSPPPNLVLAPAAIDRRPANPRVVPMAPLIATPSRDLLATLQSKSVGAWHLRWANGALVGLSGSRWSSSAGDASTAARAFLREYAPLLGLDARTLAQNQIRQMEMNTQVLHTQTLNSLPVFDSRINLIFNEHNNLIYLSSHAYAGPIPTLPAVISPAQAARAAAEGAEAYWRSRGLPGLSVTAAEWEAVAQLGYRLEQNTIAIVYKFTLDKAVPAGDLEVIVLATNATVLQVLDRARN